MTKKKATGDHLWKKGCPSPNPLGRPKKTVLPEDVRKILADASPKLMREAIKQAMAGNTRILAVLMDKLTPSLKAIEIKSSSELPTMILLGSTSDPAVLDRLKSNAVEGALAHPLPKELEMK